MTPTISVIMPVYNPGPCLAAAIAGVQNQTFADWELLLIDDGSTDGSGAICDAAARQDARIRVLRQPNAGICAARNRGLCASKGEYLAFCDDDDAYAPAFLAEALSLARQHGADAVRLDYRLTRQQPDGSSLLLPHPPGEPALLRRGAGGLAYDAFLRGTGPQFVWNALYRKSAVGALQFDPACRSGLEDFVFNANFYATANTLAYAPKLGYHHTERLASTSLSQSEQALHNRLAALQPWLQAEYRAASVWCSGDKTALAPVWNERKACAVTFLMHQLRAAGANHAMAAAAWQALRKAENATCPPEMVDFLRVAGQNRKQMAALLLYRLHLTGLYAAHRKSQ
ncbi:MAG: glycosyltransferase family 2 protein [Gemmiger sp.]|nr:glycosyltransferase family 2 protein [Gemmiger sp.]